MHVARSTHVALAIAALAACGRINFGELDDAGVLTPDTTLACNTRFKLFDAAATDPRLSASATPARIVAAWIDDDARLVVGGVVMQATDRGQPFTSPQLDPGQTITAVAIAAAGTTILRAIRDVTSTQTETRLYDDGSLDALTSTTILPAMAIRGPHGAAATGNTTGAIFTLIGQTPDPDTIATAGLDMNNVAIHPPWAHGGESVTGTHVPFEDQIAVLLATVPQCRLSSFSADLSSLGTAFLFGMGTCTQLFGAHIPGRLDLLLVNHDVPTGSVVHRIATLADVPAATTLRTPAREPRATAVADGYWVTYRTGARLEAVWIDITGTAETPKLLGPVATDTGHDVVTRAGEAYAIWLDSGLQIARLCR